MKANGKLAKQGFPNGYEKVNSREYFNRTLYGSHANDDLAEKFFTFAGDLPIFMGAVTDWSKHTACHYAKNGVLMSGLALTPGVKIPHFYSEDIDISSRWFHRCEGVKSYFCEGWMQYDLQQFSPWFPDVKVEIQAYPLLPEDGYLVHYNIHTDQRVIFCAAFGGMTDFIGRFEYTEVSERDFKASDCSGNDLFCSKNRAKLQDCNGNSLWIASSFDAEFSTASANSMQADPPGLFLASETESTDSSVVKISTEIEADCSLEGYLIIMRNQPESILDKFLQLKSPTTFIRRQIYKKHADISINTPSDMLNNTVAPTVIALDASWHKNNFCHGAHGYHSPFLGWRNWYGPNVIDWHDRVKKTILAHCSEIPVKTKEKESVWYDGGNRPDLDHEGTQYHQIRNSYGFMPCFMGGNDIYNMQEVALDMILHHLQQTGDLELAGEIFDKLSGMLDWEERILDPDADGLYQNFLNTWISDGHSYNGGGCAQASCYNYYANFMMAKIAEKLGRPSSKYTERASKVLTAVQTKLWLPEKGLIAEYIDTIGNKLVHPSPELSTIYLAVDSGVADDFQAYTMFNFIKNELRSETSTNGGKLFYSSNWYPKKYSTCGLFPAENMHLSLACFKSGQKKMALDILTALVDCYFSGKNPGLISHVLSGRGMDDFGDLDFTDVNSMYLRLLIEGLYGIRFKMLEGCIEIAPAFPDGWHNANLCLKDISLNYYRDGNQDNLRISCLKNAKKIIRIPMRSNELEAVFVNGKEHAYRIEPGVNVCFVLIETPETGELNIKVFHGSGSVPQLLTAPQNIPAANELFLEICDGEIVAYKDISNQLENIRFSAHELYAETQGETGYFTLFLHVKSGEYECFLPYDFSIKEKQTLKKFGDNKNWTPLNIKNFMNCSLHELHNQEYRSPRPTGYSIGVRLNGRYAWEWNHCGHNALKINDSQLCSGSIKTPSGLVFETIKSGNNIACVSIWDNFPTSIDIPLSGKASELALLFIGVTNPMQSYVENIRLTVKYHDECSETVKLIHPLNFDDWLVPSLQKTNETIYFSDCNHATLQRINLDPRKTLAKLQITAISNEAIIGLLALCLKR